MAAAATAALVQTHQHPLPLHLPLEVLDVLMDTIEAQVVTVKE
jgi:hypothetical protein